MTFLPNNANKYMPLSRRALTSDVIYSHFSKDQCSLLLAGRNKNLFKKRNFIYLLHAHSENYNYSTKYTIDYKKVAQDFLVNDELG